MDHPGTGPALVEAAAASFSLRWPAKVNTTIDNRGPLLLIMAARTMPSRGHRQVRTQAVPPLSTVNDLIEFPPARTRD